MIQENESERKLIACDPATEPSITVITVKKAMFEFMYGIKVEEDFHPKMLEAIRAMMADRMISYMERWSPPQPVSRMNRLTPNQQVQFLNADYAEIEMRILATMMSKGEQLEVMAR